MKMNIFFDIVLNLVVVTFLICLGIYCVVLWRYGIENMEYIANFYSVVFSIICFGVYYWLVKHNIQTIDKYCE